MVQGEQEEALQYATLAVQVADKTGRRKSSVDENPGLMTVDL